MTEQTDPHARRRRLPVWLFVFLLVLAAVSLLLHAARFQRGKEIAKLQRGYAVLVQARPIEETKARRARFYEIQYYLGYPMSMSFTIADLIRRIDGIVRPLRLLAVEVNPALHELGFKITVGVEAVFHKGDRRKLGAFLKRLANVPGVFDIASSPAPAATGKDGMRVFIVSGRAELQP